MPISVSTFTAVLMDQVQLAALAFMAVAYALKIRWILSYRAPRERTPPRGDPRAGVRYAFTTIAWPATTPGTRAHPVRWIEFAVFHAAVAVAIAVTFVMPYWPTAVGGPAAVVAIQVVLAAGAVTALSRLARRLARPEMRAISTPDDVFSLAAAAAWLAAGILAAPQRTETALVAFFGLTAFFLVYVPFSKISHYIYWPFIRYYVGRHLGHRGVYPVRSVRLGGSPAAAGAEVER
jgi:nitrate reductase gamma subunit